MDAKTKIYAAGIAICLAVLGAAALEQQEAVFFISISGMLALVSLIFVVALPLIARTSRHPVAIKALALQRQLGVCVFLFALAHVLLVMHFALGWNVGYLFAPEMEFVLIGGIAFAVLGAMALTSNDFSVKAMGKNWKRMQMLVYVAIILALAHFMNVGQLFAKNSIVVALALIATAALLFLRFKPKGKPPMNAQGASQKEQPTQGTGKQ